MMRPVLITSILLGFRESVLGEDINDDCTE
jgi:hypothetical protein